MKCEIRISHESYLGPLPNARFGAGLLDYLSSLFNLLKILHMSVYNVLRGDPVFVSPENEAGSEKAFLNLDRIILGHMN